MSPAKQFQTAQGIGTGNKTATHRKYAHTRKAPAAARKDHKSVLAMRSATSTKLTKPTGMDARPK